MGAEKFEVRASAKTAEEAFEKLRDEALYDYGHRGYTGTIAEKSEFRMVARGNEEPLSSVVDRCDRDPRHFSNDKWGPAACVDIGPDAKTPDHRVFVFFGWASS